MTNLSSLECCYFWGGGVVGRVGLFFWPWFGDLFVFLGQILVYANTICQYVQIWISCTILSGSPVPPSHALYFFLLVCCIHSLSVSTKPTFAIQLLTINFHFNIISPIGIIFYRYLEIQFFSWGFLFLFFFFSFSSVYYLKYPYSCFFSCFCFHDFVISLFILKLTLLLQAAVVRFSLLFLVYNLVPWF